MKVEQMIALEEHIYNVEVFWVVTSRSVVLACQRFGGPCCLHLQGEVKM